MKRVSWIAAVGMLFTGACSMTIDVYGVVGDNEIYTGTTTGNAVSGTMTLSDGKGKTCIGDRVGTSAAGHGLLTCNDGMRVQIQYTTLSITSGYGFGTTSNGDNVRFTYGLSREEGAKYLGPQDQQTAAAPGAPAPPTRTKGTGTGFYITRQGHVLTNAHVVDRCKELTVTAVGGAASSARVVANDKANDLAILQSSETPAAIASLRGARPVRPGETVVAYGFPLTGALSSGGVLTSGSVSALTGLRDDTRYFQISTPIQPGNSGGPLLDTTGAVVGVTSSVLNAVRAARTTGNVPQNVNFALKVGVIRTFLESAGVSAETAPGGRELGTPDIGERARAFTVLVECKG
jgi:S1-C subfamily serine protease